MDKRCNKKYSNWKNQNRNTDQKRNDCNNQQSREQNTKKTFQFNRSLYENQDAEKERIQSIQEVKARQIVCPYCNQPITDIASAIADKASGAPVHFECVIEKVRQDNPTGENEKVAYIGQGRFAVLFFENPRDQRHFTIKKIIEWEDKEHKTEWRDELSGLYSQVN